MRGSSSRNAAASRSRLSRSFAGVISASYVARGKPWRRAASAPISTNWTWCFANALKIRFGSSGATFAPVSDTARLMQEFGEVLDFVESLLRRHQQNAGHIVQHVRSHDHAWLDLRAYLETHRFQQPLERIPGRAREACLDAGNHRLGGARLTREGALAETGASAGLAK